MKFSKENVRGYYKEFPSYGIFSRRVGRIKNVMIPLGIVLLYVSLALNSLAAAFLCAASLFLGFGLLEFLTVRGDYSDRYFIRCVLRDPRVSKWYYLLEPQFENRSVGYIIYTNDFQFDGEWFERDRMTYKGFAIIALFAKYLPIWDSQEIMERKKNIRRMSKELERIDAELRKKMEDKDEVDYLKRVNGD